MNKEGEETPPAESGADQGVAEDAAQPGASDGSAAGAGGESAGPTSPLDELRERVSSAAAGFLKARLGLEEDADGTLHLPQRGVFEDVGQRADQFLRGFLKGVVERTPEEREADAGLRDKADVPSATEVVGRLLSKASGAVSTSFHQYLKDHVAADPKEPVVVDGKFLLRHGAPLLAGFVQALGAEFAEQAAATGEDAPSDPAPPGEDTPPPRVDYKVDLPSLFTSLFVRPKSGEGGEP